MTERKRATAATSTRARKVRQYSRAFTPRAGDPDKHPATWGCEYKISRIPASFWKRVRAKADRDGVSLRYLVLSYLQQWLDDKAA